MLWQWQWPLLLSTQLQMPELLAFDDDASSKWWQKINEAMEVVFCDYNNLVLGCECVCEGSKRAELGRRWRRQNSENLHWREARPKAVCNMLFVKVLAAKKPNFPWSLR